MKPRVGLVVVGNEAESGLERAGWLLKTTKDRLAETSVDVVQEQNAILTDADAIQAGRRFREANTDLIVLIHATWVRDSIPYLLAQGSGSTLFLWGLPYPETYSLAAVQHFAGILRNRGIGFKYAYGLPSQDKVIEAIAKYARVVKLVKREIPYHIGLIGPRPTWRAFGAQDMTMGEWDLSELLRASIIHVEMSEFQETVLQMEDNRKKALIKRMQHEGKLPRTHEIEDKRLLRAAAEYLAIEEIRERYLLDAATIETYPYAWGFANLAASWLGDDRFVLETEGDLVRTTLMHLLVQLGTSPVMLGELAKTCPEDNLLYFGHAGSTALSLAESLDRVRFTAEGKAGCFVQFPLKELAEVTLVNLWQSPDSYNLFAGITASKGMTTEEWENMGGVSLAKLEVKWDVENPLDFFIAKGMEHHFLVVEGDLREDLIDLATLLNISTTSL